jgi:hypothetical protein
LNSNKANYFLSGKGEEGMEDLVLAQIPGELANEFDVELSDGP